MARGARKLRMNGEEVEYNSLSDMRQVLARMEAEVAGATAGAISIVYPYTTRGLDG